MRAGLDEEGKDYTYIFQALLEVLGAKKELKKEVEEALSIAIDPKEDSVSFLEQDYVAYEKARIFSKQKVFLLSTAAVSDLLVHNFVVLNAPKTYQELKRCLL